MKMTVMVTGSATGIGNLTARALVAAGHTVSASMRDPVESNARHALDLIEFGETHGGRMHIAQLDVRSQVSADSAVSAVIDKVGTLDVVVRNAGHLAVSYAEAFTAEDLERLFDVNVFGMHRVNRAALPHTRSRGSGVLIYVGSTSTVSLPPFLAPYVASKSAFDALAATTAYEVGRFEIETSIVTPGAFTSGTQHFANASRASDESVAAAYARLDAYVARNEEATHKLFGPGVIADPGAVAQEIVRILALPPVVNR